MIDPIRWPIGQFPPQQKHDKWSIFQSPTQGNSSSFLSATAWALLAAVITAESAKAAASWMIARIENPEPDRWVVAKTISGVLGLSLSGLITIQSILASRLDKKIKFFPDFLIGPSFIGTIAGISSYYACENLKNRVDLAMLAGFQTGISFFFAAAAHKSENRV